MTTAMLISGFILSICLAIVVCILIDECVYLFCGFSVLDKIEDFLFNREK